MMDREAKLWEGGKSQQLTLNKLRVDCIVDNVKQTGVMSNLFQTEDHEACETRREKCKI